MNGLNKIECLGYLGKDPEIRYTKDGKAVASFSVGASESWKDKDGNKQERTEWFNCSAFGKLAEIIGQYLKKGSRVYLEGKQRTEKYQAKDGADRYATKMLVSNMIMLDSKPKTQDEPVSDSQEPANSMPDFDDSIPF